jgi:hypothetical protein
LIDLNGNYIVDLNGNKIYDLDTELTSVCDEVSTARNTLSQESTINTLI